MDALLRQQDSLFYATFPDALRDPASDNAVQVAHIIQFSPSQAQPLLVYGQGGSVYDYPDPDGWAYHSPQAQAPDCPPPLPPSQEQPRLVLALPSATDHPYPYQPQPPQSAHTTPTSPFSPFDDASQSPPPSAFSTHSSLSVFTDGSEQSATEVFCESPQAFAGRLEDVLPAMDDDEGTVGVPSIARKPQRRPGVTKRRSKPYDSAEGPSERRASSTRRKKDKNVNPDNKPPLACLFCRGRKIACGPPLKNLGLPMDGCNQCQRRSLKCEYPSESRRGMRKKKPESGGASVAGDDEDDVGPGPVLVKDEDDDPDAEREDGAGFAMVGGMGMVKDDADDDDDDYPLGMPMPGPLDPIGIPQLAMTMPSMAAFALPTLSPTSTLSSGSGSGSGSSLDSALGAAPAPVPVPPMASLEHPHSHPHPHPHPHPQSLSTASASAASSSTPTPIPRTRDPRLAARAGAQKL